MTKISWTNQTWNPVTGCSKTSAGCQNCYAERLSLKFGWSKAEWTGKNAKQNVVCHPERLTKPFRITQPSRIFVNSMSDLFHPLVPDEFIQQVFDVMGRCPQHIFQVLTKRSARVATWDYGWAPNIWMGVSIENRAATNRLDDLLTCSAAVKFISFEPLIGSVGELSLKGIDWAIVGGESGPGFRPMEMSWAREIRDICVRDGVAFFFKQDAAPRTEMRPFLVEEDGTRWKWEQYPEVLTPPERVE